MTSPFHDICSATIKPCHCCCFAATDFSICSVASEMSECKTLLKIDHLHPCCQRMMLWDFTFALAAGDKIYHDGTMVPSCTMARERLRHKASLRYFSFSRSPCDRVCKTKQKYMWKTFNFCSVKTAEDFFLLLLIFFYFLKQTKSFPPEILPRKQHHCWCASLLQQSSILLQPFAKPDNMLTHYQHLLT